MIKALFKLFKRTPPAPHEHVWEWLHDERHFWTLYPDGSSTGMYCRIDDAIKLRQPGSEYSDPKKLEKLLWWKSLGFTAVHTSWHIYRCECGKTIRTEFYQWPFVVDDSPQAVAEREAIVKAVVKLVT